MKVRVDIMLKDAVLDPQGKAIGHALESLGFGGIRDVRMGKTVVVEFDETDETKAKDMAKAMAEKLLANLVIEDYRICVI